jgi:beta-glucosidase-like glycosyl hydrolase
MKRQQWVDSVYQSLPLEKKIAQLYMAIAHTKSNMPHVEKLVKDLGIGGICFMQGDPAEQMTIMRALQQKAKIPLWFSMDAEWGMGMRLPNVGNLPRALTIGAANDTSLALRVGRAIGRQFQRMGIHINFAPVLDINSNPNNPVINYRSFGENKVKVSQMALYVIRGMQEMGVIACAKHFPGHGNTDVDSHLSLPLIKESFENLERTDLYPYRSLIPAGLKAVMTGHLSVPALDATPNLPSSLSTKVVQDLLIEKMGFDGLVFTDGLNMSSVTKLYSSAALDLRSLMAGNDVLLFSKHSDQGIDTIRRSYEKGLITEARLSRSVKKVLAAKYDAGLLENFKKDTSDIARDLNDSLPEIRKAVAQAAITCVKDEYDLIQSIRKADMKDITMVTLSQKQNMFETEFAKQGLKNIVQLYLPDNNKRKQQWARIRSASKVIVNVSGLYQSPAKNFGLDSLKLKLLQELSELPNVCVVIFGNPYVLRNFCDVKSALICYDEETETQLAAIEIFTRQMNPKGQLPVSVCPKLKEGQAFKSPSW